jgi:all-trans-retinol 13,14-reductase
MTDRNEWDVIVVGSGIGGLAAGAALARNGRRVLLLERHFVLGGLTQTFERDGFRWDVGVHYLSDYGPDSPEGRLLRRLGVDDLRFGRLPEAYDRLHFPQGFRFDVRAPESAWLADLKAAFPAQKAAIDGYYTALEDATSVGPALFAARSTPSLIGQAVRWWQGSRIERWAPLTTAEVIGRFVDDPKLAAVLAAQWGDFGGTPREGSFVLHALVTRSFRNGAFYPVGGAGAIAPAFVRVIERAGGQARLRAHVSQILLDGDRAVGVELADGSRIRARTVISDIGARGTIERLLPPRWRDTDWARRILALAPNIANVALYLGLEGDIAAAGASAANDWWYDTWSVDDVVWRDPFEQDRPLAVFVSFPSLKDPAHRGNRHTAELHAWADWQLFESWQSSDLGARDGEYLALKESLQRTLLDVFREKYPGLSAMIRFSEASTPLTMLAFTGHEQGAFYGLETSPRRLMCDALSPRTPIGHLILAGQDVCTPGIGGALVGGVMAAGVVEPRVFGWLR